MRVLLTVYLTIIFPRAQPLLPPHAFISVPSVLFEEKTQECAYLLLFGHTRHHHYMSVFVAVRVHGSSCGIPAGLAMGKEESRLSMGKEESRLSMGKEESRLSMGKEESRLSMGKEESRLSMGKEESRLSMGKEESRLSMGKEESRLSRFDSCKF